MAIEMAKQDKQKAIKLYLKACDGGEMVGCSNLGVMYYKGDDVAQNKKIAMDLFKMACDGVMKMDAKIIVY